METDLTEAKVAGLRQVLAREGAVTFKNGATITVVDEGFGLRIGWPGTEETGYVNECAYHQHARAYSLALAGPPPPLPPRPAPIKRLRGNADRFGECPF